MQQNIKRRGLFSLISPFLVYFGVALVVQIFAAMFVVFSNLPALMESIDPKVLESIQSIEQVQQLYVNEDVMNMILEQYMKQMTVITAASSLCVIPFFAWMFRRDKRYELSIGIPQMIKRKSQNYFYVVGFAMAASLAFNIILLLSNLGAYSEGYQAANEALYSGSFVVELIGLGIITPIAEELMFRGLIYRRVRCMIGPKQAIVVSGFVFGMYHGNLIQGIYGVLIGCIMAWLYENYGSLIAPILFHVFANVVSIIATEYDIFTWIFEKQIRVVVIAVVSAAFAATMYVKIKNMFLDYQKDVEIDKE